MAALTADRPVPNYVKGTGVIVDMVVTASATIYEGSFVAFTAGTGTIIGNAGAGLVIAGIATKGVVASATAGATKIPVLTGAVISHAVSSGAATSIGKVVFAADDNVLDLASATFGAVGRVLNYNPVSGLCAIQMKVTGEVSGSTGTTYTAGAL